MSEAEFRTVTFLTRTFPEDHDLYVTRYEYQRHDHHLELVVTTDNGSIDGTLKTTTYEVDPLTGEFEITGTTFAVPTTKEA